jgi:sulfate transport system ATP-binding protein
LTAFLDVEGIVKRYGGDLIIDGISLKVEKGKVLAILGPSGCGKTTLLRIIAGLAEQDEGKVFMDSKRLDGVPVNRRGVGFVFQHYSLFPHLTVRENIEFGLKMRKADRDIIDAKVEQLMELIGLGGMEDRRPTQLSGGQQQRVALARALAPDPKILLLDEPFGALDAKIRRRIRRDLKKLQRRLGVTTLFVTHDQEEAFEVGDEIAVMNEGRIEQVDLPRNLYENPKSLFVAKFVGNVNVMRVNGGRRSVLVRPEDVLLDKGGDDGVLVNYLYLGPVVEVVVDTNDTHGVLAMMPKSDFIIKGFRRGDPLKISVRRYRAIPRCS